MLLTSCNDRAQLIASLYRGDQVDALVRSVRRRKGVIYHLLEQVETVDENLSGRGNNKTTQHI